VGECRETGDLTEDLATNAASPESIRHSIRNGEWRRGTGEIGAGFVQANLVALPAEMALAFLTFCWRNSRACPLLDVTDVGSSRPLLAAPSADLRTDLPRYRVYEKGRIVAEPESVVQQWSESHVGFLLGCSFTFEAALLEAGIRLRHIEEGKVVSMFLTNWPCRPSPPFGGQLVVSMRPIPRDKVRLAHEISARFPFAHGAPVHVGNPEQLGIKDLSRPDYGDPVSVRPNEEPVFWACGVTGQLAAAQVKSGVVIGHYPGHMFITDWPSRALTSHRLPADWERLGG